MISKLKIIVISDTHCKYHAQLPPGDILIHCGDFTSIGTENQILEFIQWLKVQHYKHKVVIAGNHDILLDVDDYKRLQPRFHKYKVYDQNDKSQLDIIQ